MESLLIKICYYNFLLLCLINNSTALNRTIYNILPSGKVDLRGILLDQPLPMGSIQQIDPFYSCIIGMLVLKAVRNKRNPGLVLTHTEAFHLWAFGGEFACGDDACHPGLPGGENGSVN